MCKVFYLHAKINVKIETVEIIFADLARKTRNKLLQKN
jgi:hypothetical protein